MVLSRVSICARHNLDIIGVKIDSRLTFEDHVRGSVSSVSQRIVFLRLVKRFFVDTSVLLRCYYAFVLPIIENWGSAAECHIQLLEYQAYSVARLSPDQTFLSLCHRSHIAALCVLYKVNLNSNNCLFSELPSSSVRVRHIRAAAIELEVSKCRTSQFARCFLPNPDAWGMTFPTLCLTKERYICLREQSIVVFSFFPWCRCL